MSFSDRIKTAKTDEWYTPDYAVEIILPHLHYGLFTHVWCPFDTEESEFVRILTREGFDVTYGHIATGQDFFKYEHPPSGVECVVSNPPFSKRQAIFEKLFDWKIPFALIMNSNGLFDAKSRWKLFNDNPFELLIPQGRMKFSDGKGLKNNPNFQSIYVCSRILPKQIVFSDMEVSA